MAFHVRSGEPLAAGRVRPNSRSSVPRALTANVFACHRNRDRHLGPLQPSQVVLDVLGVVTDFGECRQPTPRARGSNAGRSVPRTYGEGIPCGFGRREHCGRRLHRGSHHGAYKSGLPRVLPSFIISEFMKQPGIQCAAGLSVVRADCLPEVVFR